MIIKNTSLSLMDDAEHPQLLCEQDYLTYTDEINCMVNE